MGYFEPVRAKIKALQQVHYRSTELNLVFIHRVVSEMKHVYRQTNKHARPHYYTFILRA
jgi:hypothetical protein